MAMAGRLGAAGASGERRQKEGLGWSQPSEALSPGGAGIRACVGGRHTCLHVCISLFSLGSAGGR